MHVLVVAAIFIALKKPSRPKRLGSFFHSVYDYHFELPRSEIRSARLEIVQKKYVQIYSKSFMIT